MAQLRFRITNLAFDEDDANDEDSYGVAELEVAWWNGEIQVEEGDKDARKAIFI